MSGLEIVAAVAGIVSAIVCVWNQIKKAIASRKSNKLNIPGSVETAEHQLLNTLQGSPSTFTTNFEKTLLTLA